MAEKEGSEPGFGQRMANPEILRVVEATVGPGILAPKKLNLMTLNDNKAGMTGLDKEKISAIIENASKGSKFYAKQKETQARIDGQIDQLKERLSALTPKELLTARHEADLFIDQLLSELVLRRTIVHVDMDMFYAAVEMRDNPELRDKPMAVGGMGMLSTSNYAARKFGVRAAMPGFIGLKLCPDLVLVPVDMKKYAEVAEVIREVFKEYDENYSPMSLDEAYMDITEYLELNPDFNSWDVVQEMREKIESRTQLTASAGIAPNTFLAKVCSDLNKPNGQYILQPNQTEILDFVRKLSIRKACGIGNVSEQMLNGIGVKSCEDLYLKRAEIKLLFSAISFQHYMQISQGIGGTRLEPPEDRVRKSISTETTFKDQADRTTLIDICRDLCGELSEDMTKRDILGGAVTIKIKSHDFKTKTRVRQLAAETSAADVIFGAAKQLLTLLLDQSGEQPLALRLMGVRMSELKNKNDVKSKQSTLFSFLNQEGGRQPYTCPNKETYNCPICDQQVVGLDNLNKHIDAGCTTEHDTLENLHSGKKIHERKESSCDVTAESSKFSALENAAVEINSDSVLNSSKQPSVLTCPVCFKETFSEETKLNQHIDVCLNRTEIDSILAGSGPRSEGGNKRKSDGELTGLGSKKPKLKMSNKIDSYFKRT